MTYYCIIGILYNYTNERRYDVINLMLALTGIGSFCLHASLSSLYQASDELPMLLVSISFLYALAETNRGNYTGAHGPERKYLAIVSVIAVVMNGLFYFQFQKLWIVFVFNYAATAITIAVWSCVLAVRPPKSLVLSPSQRHLRYVTWRTSMVLYIVIGFSCWMVDMHACTVLMSLLPQYGITYPTLHVIWHYGAGVGSYYVGMFLQIVRYQAKGFDAEIRYKWLVPYVVCNVKSQ